MFILLIKPALNLHLFTHMLLSTDTFLLSRIQGRIQKDKKLANAIEGLKLVKLNPLGYRLKIISTPFGASEINEKLVWIVRVAISFAPVIEVDFNGDLLSIKALSTVSPSVTIPADGEHDRRLRMKQIQQKNLLYRAAIEALSNDYSVFLMTPEGMYKDVHFHAGTKSLIPAERLINKFLHEVISAAAADTVLECLQLAQKTGQTQECYYDITFEETERRWYYGKAYPSNAYPNNEHRLLLLTVKRLN